MEAETESYGTRGGATQYKHQQNVLATVVYFRYQYEGQLIHWSTQESGFQQWEA